LQPGKREIDSVAGGVLRVVDDPADRVHDDLVDIAGPEQNGFRGAKPLRLLMLPQSIEVSIPLVEGEMPVAARVNKSDRPWDIVCCRKSRLFGLCHGSNLPNYKPLVVCSSGGLRLGTAKKYSAKS
jgi:hypothetical protein